MGGGTKSFGVPLHCQGPKMSSMCRVFQKDRRGIFLTIKNDECFEGMNICLM